MCPAQFAQRVKSTSKGDITLTLRIGLLSLIEFSTFTRLESVKSAQNLTFEAGGIFAYKVSDKIVLLLGLPHIQIRSKYLILINRA